MTENSNISLDLSALETLNAVDIFKPGNMDKLLESIETEVKSLVFDVSTAKGRKEIASMKWKISRSKTTLDSLGKDLVSGWKEQAKVVDRERKLVRDRLDAVRNYVGEPLKIWEEEKKAEEEKKRLAEEIELAHGYALLENKIFDNEMAARKRIEEEKRKADEADRIKYEDQIKRDAEDEATLVQMQDSIKNSCTKAFPLITDTERVKPDVEHRREVNISILDALMQNAIDENTAKTFIYLVAWGKIPRMKILY